MCSEALIRQRSVIEQGGVLFINNDRLLTKSESSIQPSCVIKVNNALVQIQVLYITVPPSFSRVIFNEVVQTSKYYMRDVTAVESSWLVELAPHFYKQAKVRPEKLTRSSLLVKV